MKTLFLLLNYPVLVFAVGFGSAIAKIFLAFNFIQISAFLIEETLAIAKSNQDIIYIGKVFKDTFKHRKWWILSYWKLFTQDFKTREWTARYNQWPKKNAKS